MFTPRIDILPAAQPRLWAELDATPASFTLYDGTAIALPLGHRVSVDFDFFPPVPFSTADLRLQVPYLAGGTLLQEAPNTLTMALDRDGPVQVSFVGRLRLGQVEPHDTLAMPAITVASLVDLGGMKAAVVTQRAEPKDYFDIHALMGVGISLDIMLAAALTIYGEAFNPLVALKAISYHDEAELQALPDGLRRDLIAAVRKVDVTRLPTLIAVKQRKGLS